MPYIGWVELNFRLSSCNHDFKVPLVTEQRLDSPITGFYVIDEIIKGSNVNFIASLNEEELCCINTTKRDTTIPPKQSLRVTCRANTGPVGRPTPALFEPDEIIPWPNGLEISETLLTVKKGKSCQVDIDITNNSNH